MRAQDLDKLSDGDIRKIMGYPRYQRENFQLVLKLVDVLGAIGARHGATSAQIALAWCLAKDGVTAPIVGTTQLANLQEILGASSCA